MTILTDEFLKEELDLNLETANTEKVYKNYYRITCDNVARINKYLLTSEEIEEFLETGHTKRMWAINSPIKSAEERKRLFKLAQGRQLMFDIDNSRLAMVVNADLERIVCPESLVLLKQLGLEQKVRF